MIITEFLKNERPDYKVGKIVHVGAHWGEEAGAYDEFSPQSVTWIEADPNLFQTLKQRMEENAANYRATQHVIQAAVSDTDGETALLYRFSNDGASNSLFQMLPPHQRKFPSVVPEGEPVDVQTATLDVLLDGHPGVAPDVLVIDGQGSELKCLRGAHKTMQSVRFLECEVSTEALYEGGVLFDELNAYITKLGFVRRTTVVPWHGDVVYERKQPSWLRRIFNRFMR